MVEQVASGAAGLLSLTEPALIVRSVAADVAGRRVFMTWLGDARCAHLRPVQCAVVEVVGCHTSIDGRVEISVLVDTFDPATSGPRYCDGLRFRDAGFAFDGPSRLWNNPADGGMVFVAGNTAYTLGQATGDIGVLYAVPGVPHGSAL